MKNNSFRVLIVGCGNLGSRHLQAVASLPFVREIEVVDPRPEALARMRDLLAEMPQHPSGISFRWITSLEDGTPGGDLCIIATQAKGRSEIVFRVNELLHYRNFLVEKVVTQSVPDYERLLDFSKRKRLSVWVNCKSRAYPIHRYVKSKLQPEEPILFNSMAGNHGLANNGVHAVDLFSFYDASKEIKCITSLVDPILHPSKRGEDVFDLSGTLIGKTAKGGILSLSYATDHVGPDHISIVTKSYRCIIDHFCRWAVENEGEKGDSWRPVSFEGNLMVSQMTKAFVTDILKNSRCQLPTLEECWPAHRFILGALQPHFSRLLGKDLDYCPVT